MVAVPKRCAISLQDADHGQRARNRDPLLLPAGELGHLRLRVMRGIQRGVTVCRRRYFCATPLFSRADIPPIPAR